MKVCVLRFVFAVMFAFFAQGALADDNGGGGGGTGGGGGNGAGGSGSGSGQQNSNGGQGGGGQHVLITREELDRLIAQAAKGGKGEGGGSGNGGDDDKGDLRKKVQKEREDREKSEADAKVIEQVVAFNLGLDGFVERNKDLLPSEIPDIVRAASAERYETAAEKAAAVKRAIIESYFAVQANVDCLTETQKRELDDYQRLTVKGRTDRAAVIYSTLFEPTLEMNRRIRKAEELARGSRGVPANSAVAEYHKKLIEASNRKYAHKQ